ncbi:hypothetical protein EK21DRAFT_113365 [Setomelanomma holmii]|uniref:Uncharacterized protein n=1 Tax=Setomelanomma holmii TaxID=210430 RepID=A0A9P4H6E5_9PLEO|nr:hypothetical protein EK21DRAFT_113365 [Setomelanomma holmii]
MQTQYSDDLHGQSLPEVHHQEQSYIYSVPDKSPAYAVPNAPPTIGYDHAPATDAAYSPAGKRRIWTQWWVLALIGLAVAIIAGLVGGFIGQAIQRGREPSNGSASAPSSSSCPTNSSSSATTPPSGSSNTTFGTIVRPDTGCNYPASKPQQKRIPGVSLYWKQNYTTICNSGWSGPNSGIVGMWTLTPGDCIEACHVYNLYGSNRNKPCLGGGFIPDWTDRDEGAKMNNGAPFNCFLQSNTTGISPNDRDAVEVVALCMTGQCDNIGTV